MTTPIVNTLFAITKKPKITEVERISDELIKENTQYLKLIGIDINQVTKPFEVDLVLDCNEKIGVAFRNVMISMIKTYRLSVKLDEYKTDDKILAFNHLECSVRNTHIDQKQAIALKSQVFTLKKILKANSGMNYGTIRMSDIYDNKGKSMIKLATENVEFASLTLDGRKQSYVSAKVRIVPRITSCIYRSRVIKSSKQSEQCRLLYRTYGNLISEIWPIKETIKICIRDITKVIGYMKNAQIQHEKQLRNFENVSSLLCPDNNYKIIEGTTTSGFKTTQFSMNIDDNIISLLVASCIVGLKKYGISVGRNKRSTLPGTNSLIIHTNRGQAISYLVTICKKIIKDMELCYSK